MCRLRVLMSDHVVSARATHELDRLGSCTADFSMTFAAGQDGRGANEFSFLPMGKASVLSDQPYE
jgi:hypothetical protein